MISHGSLSAPAWDPDQQGQPVGGAFITSSITSYGPQQGGTNPCIIVRQGEDPAPTCVNPKCPRADNCRKHIVNRTDKRKPSIAIITWYECGHYDPIDPEKYKKHEQKHSSTTTA